ncbi:MAG: alpha/beta fold hydrolase [Deltaproteobacteria bacterium]|nr:alpha/beta fold hydrolase [Deltaproteobacteria bacterium]
MGYNNVFMPPAWLRGMYTQTILASSRLRTIGKNPMLDASHEVILDAGGGVRLQGFYSPQRSGRTKALVILIHGWEGSSSSTYVLHTGRYLYNQGYAVFRLNLRDHGETHHLNDGLFFITFLDEVFEAIKKASALSQGKAVFLAGFSLGGNFALRVARRAQQEPIDCLAHVMAISPVIDPSKSTAAIDNNRLLKYYFMKKWRRSLNIKQGLYPHLYDFSSMVSMGTIWAITEAFVNKYSCYKDIHEYFRGYTISRDFLKDVCTDMTIVVSRDDPVIPIDEFHHLCLNANTELVVHDYGGHNGFVYGISAATWYEKRMAELFSKVLEIDPDWKN